jgi:hypothetical protein
LKLHYNSTLEKLGKTFISCCLGGMLFVISAPQSGWAQAPVSSPAEQGSVKLGSKHVYIMQPGMDEIWGSYIFVLQGPQAGGAYRGQLALPEQKIEFGPQQGMTADQLQFDEKLGVLLDKKDVIGTKLYAVGFNVPAVSGQAAMSIDLNPSMKELVIMAPVGQLELVAGSGFGAKSESNFMGKDFDTWNYRYQGDSVVNFELKGIATGRYHYWWLGGVLAFIMMGAALYLTIATKES